MQDGDEAQQHHQADVLELTCNGMVSCLYSIVMYGHNADSATDAFQQCASLQTLIYGVGLGVLRSIDAVKCLAGHHSPFHVLLTDILKIFRASDTPSQTKPCCRLFHMISA